MAKKYPPSDFKKKGSLRIQPVLEDDDGSLPFLKQDPFSDVALVVEGRKLHTARSLLAFNSPVLAKELSHGKKQDLDLPRKEYEDMKEFLSYIDPRVPYIISDASARRLLPLAKEYEMPKLMRGCEEVLLNSYKTLRKDHPIGTIPSEINEAYLQIADIYEFDPLLRMCVEEYVRCPEVQHTRSLVDADGVSDKVKLMILEKKLSTLNRELEKERRYRNSAEQQLDVMSPRKLWRNK